MTPPTSLRHLLSMALSLLLLASAPARAASQNQECTPRVLATLAQALQVKHFGPSPDDDGKDPDGVVLASSCRRMPDDPRLTLAAVGWETHKAYTKGLVIALVDEAAGTTVALLKDEIDEDATTRVTRGSLRLDTAPYLLAPGVRAVGLDLLSDNVSCAEGGIGAARTLYVREGRTLRPVLADLLMSEYTYLRGNQTRCVSDRHDAETAIVEDYDVTIALGAAGKGGWRDLLLTVAAKRDDHKPSTHQPLHVTVPYDGATYSLSAFHKAYDQWLR